MDEIYFLLGLLYIAYSIYRAVKKRKDKRVAPQPAKVNKPEPAKGKKTFEQMLEEMLTGQSTAAPDPESEYETFDEDAIREPEAAPQPAASLETIPSSAYFSYDNVVGRQTVESMMSTEQGEGAAIPASARQGMNLDWLYENGTLDLRKAVIYSEILNRPYT